MSTSRVTRNSARGEETAATSLVSASASVPASSISSAAVSLSNNGNGQVASASSDEQKRRLALNSSSSCEAHDEYYVVDIDASYFRSTQEISAAASGFIENLTSSTADFRGGQAFSDLDGVKSSRVVETMGTSLIIDTDSSELLCASEKRIAVELGATTVS